MAIHVFELFYCYLIQHYFRMAFEKTRPQGKKFYRSIIKMTNKHQNIFIASKNRENSPAEKYSKVFVIWIRSFI